MAERPVVLEIPASSAYLVLVRTAASSVCARLDYPIDRLEDVALACGEAAGLLLKDIAPGARMTITFRPYRQAGRSGPALIGVAVEMSARTQSGRPPRPTSFAWTVLGSLMNHVEADADGDVVTLRLESREEAVTVP